MRIESLNNFEKKVLRGSVTEHIDSLMLESIPEAYYTKTIKKKDNSDRILQCIDNEHVLFKIQKQLKNNYFDFIPLSNYAYGYVKGKSYYDYLKPHINHNFYLRLDIKNFFESIKEKKLREVLKYTIDDDIKINEDISLLDFIMKIVTLNGSLPQGAVTSPVLSNVFFRHLDIRISRYCKKFGIEYSRYVDDMLFSSNELYIHKKVFLNGIIKILKSCGFYLNNKKVLKTKKEISLNGFVVGTDIRLSRKKTALLSSLIYCYQHSQKKNIDNLLCEIRNHFNLDSNKKINLLWLHNYLAGYRSFLLGLLPFDSVGVMPEDTTKVHQKLLFKINEIEKILDIIAFEI
ncbi:reverse transcriptase family protein [Paenibacillus sp. MMS20-IR301]|uniref:reverse transcriptase family protein n=1 Tax=Paenibacillus sp. MMS20-IR301 TaxID=2895946 RepID=UPI0028E6D128|nr:reverse transcriptase family protein [Paenibacillus sp. MMS20-IR301]WNS43889.1 reverse transcriptase family protein [Paenibacillus sp. MMS20-IR301]